MAGGFRRDGNRFLGNDRIHGVIARDKSMQMFRRDAISGIGI
jgi:hypothetical protein